MPDRRDNPQSPATATGLANSEFESFFNIKGTRHHRVDSYPFIKGKLDVYSLIFFPSSGRGILHMVEADGALVARTVNARDDNGQLIIHRFVDALSGSGAYANLVRAIGHYTQGFDGEVVANDINPLIPLTQWTLLNRRPALEQELRTVVNQLAAIATNFNIHINETNLRILPNRQEGDPRLSNAEWNERFRAQTGTDNDPEAQIRLARFRDAVKNYFNTELIACHQPGAATNGPPAIMSGKEARASALFYVAQWGIPSQYNVGHSLLRQHPMRLSTWREYYLPIDIVRRKNSYTPCRTRSGNRAQRCLSVK